MRLPQALVAFLLASSALVALGPLAGAAGSSCTDEVNDAGCGGTLCVSPSPTFDGACTPFTATQKACTAGHDVCGASDVVCVYGKTTTCLAFQCACDPMQAQSTPGCAGCVPVLCVAGVTAPQCWGVGGAHDACLYFSEEVPFCADVPATITINCGALPAACDPNPCDWGWFECAPCACLPQDMNVAVPML